MATTSWRALSHCHFVAHRHTWQNLMPTLLQHCYMSSTAVASDREETRFNQLGIQMLSKSLHDQLFSGREDVVPPETMDAIKEHLIRHKLWGREGSVVADTPFKLPPIRGRNPDEHFRQIAIDQSEPYLTYAKHLVRRPLPPMPNEWVFHSGWTKYDALTGERSLVDCPDERVLVLDVEVCVKESPLPVLATAASEDAWYSWVCNSLVERKQFGWLSQCVVENLIPLESCGRETERLVVGHMVGYDRARIREQYDFNATHTKFLDTASLHMSVSGFSSLQRALVMKERKMKTKTRQWKKEGTMNSLEDVHQFYVGGNRLDKGPRDIFIQGTLNDVYTNFQHLMSYCANDVHATHQVLCVVLPLFLKRLPHPVTFAGMLEMGLAYLPVDQSWNEYLDTAEKRFCDLEGEMKSNLMKLADQACSFGHNEKYKSDPWLYDLDWKIPKYLKKRLPKSAPSDTHGNNHSTNKLVDEDSFQSDIWRQHLSGYPNWYRKVCPRIEEQAGFGASLISAQTQITPSLLRLQWDGHPLYNMKKYGWGYLIPLGGNTERFNEIVQHSLETHSGFSLSKRGAPEDQMVTSVDVIRFIEEIDVLDIASTDMWQALEALELGTGVGNGDTEKIDENEEVKIALKKVPGLKKEIIIVEHPLLGKVRFVPLPHKDGNNHNVGNPLAKNFLSKMEDGTLTSGSGDLGKQTLRINKILSFWRNNKKRICDQFAVWLDGKEIDSQWKGERVQQLGVILPQIRVAGTVTRRAVEPTWLTASNPKEDSLGSEQKAMIRAPPGYNFVGADVDSQELWIAAILGDSQFAGIHGCTAFGWMTLQGQKSDGTDLHSKTASTIGITRDQAKVFNYGRIYGAGLPFAVHLLQQFNHRLSEEDATMKAKQLYMTTKGKRRYQLSDVGFDFCQQYGIEWDSNGEISSEEMIELQSLTKRSPRVLSAYQRWSEGSESEMFNKLESVISEREPQTPVLGCRISRPLDTAVVGEEFKTSRINWVVQSSAVDYLHLLLVSMRWLFDKYKIDGRFCISIHDEVRYLVKREDRHRAALALQIGNLLTRVMFAYKLGMNDLPQAVAFFSAVDIDTVLRKEVNMDCQTPSNPHGLQKGEGIEHGEALDIYSILELTDGGNLEGMSQQ